MELKHYLQVLLRRKWVILITLASVLLVVFIGSQLMTPLFEGLVTLRVSTAASGQGNYTSATFITNLLNTTANLATSNQVLNELRDRLNLKDIPEVEYEIIPNTELIKISVTDPDPNIAFEGAKVIGEIVISRGTELISGGADTETFLISQIEQVEGEILEIRKEYDALLLQTPPATTEADLLYQELLLKQRNYDSLVSTLQEAQYANAMRANMITIVEQPEFPKEPSSPNLIINMLIGGAAGLLFGIILAFVLDSFDTTLFETHEIEKYTGLKAFSHIPKVRNPHSKLTSDGNSAFAESFRKLALRLLQLDQKQPIKVIIVLSGEPKQGKSMLVSHLALRLAEFGKKVVAVDCDLHIPRLHIWFGLPNTIGLRDVLEDDLDLTEALQETNVENISVMTSGEKPKKTTLLLSSERMKLLVSKLSDRFDFVLLDSPALLEVGDTEVISECADTFILIVRREESSREGVISASNYVQKFSDKLSLLVVNQDMESEGYYYYPNGLGRGNIINNIKRNLDYRKKAKAFEGGLKVVKKEMHEREESLPVNEEPVHLSDGHSGIRFPMIIGKIKSWFQTTNKPEMTKELKGMTKRNIKANAITRSKNDGTGKSTENISRMVKRNLINNLYSRMKNR